VDLEGLDDLGASLSNTSPNVKLSISFSEFFLTNLIKYDF
jgi:adenosine/AMP kinase